MFQVGVAMAHLSRNTRERGVAEGAGVRASTDEQREGKTRDRGARWENEQSLSLRLGSSWCLLPSPQGLAYSLPAAPLSLLQSSNTLVSWT